MVSLGAGLDQLAGLHSAASGLLLALLDRDTHLWLSPGAAVGATAASLKFHSGCFLAASPAEADFALVAVPGELPPLAEFSPGSQEYPERSATVVIQVPAIVDTGWRLTGPGIRNEVQLSVPAQSPALITSERSRPQIPSGLRIGGFTGGCAIVWSRSDRPDCFVHYGDTIYADGPIAAEVKQADAKDAQGRDMFEAVANASPTEDGQYYGLAKIDAKSGVFTVQLKDLNGAVLWDKGLRHQAG